MLTGGNDKNLNFNPFKQNGLVYPHEKVETISNLRGAGRHFSFF